MPDFIGARSEFEQLRDKLKKEKLKNVTDIRNALELHFKSIEWSLLKIEWDRMNEKDRTKLVTKLLSEM